MGIRLSDRRGYPQILSDHGSRIRDYYMEAYTTRNLRATDHVAIPSAIWLDQLLPRSQPRMRLMKTQPDCPFHRIRNYLRNFLRWTHCQSPRPSTGRSPTILRNSASWRLFKNSVGKKSLDRCSASQLFLFFLLIYRPVSSTLLFSGHYNIIQLIALYVNTIFKSPVFSQ